MNNVKLNFGFTFSLNKGPQTNAFNIISSYPLPLLLCQPSHSSYHNLCIEKLPSYVKSLLQLGLSFCPTPKLPTDVKYIDLNRFRNDFQRICYFTDNSNTEETELNEFWCRNESYVSEPLQSNILQLRLNNFVSTVHELYLKNTRKNQNYLLPLQGLAMKWLKDNPNIIVCSADKNLGPCTIEATRYCDFAFRDHLSTSTYKKLNYFEAHTLRDKLVQDINWLINHFYHDKHYLDSDQFNFITRKMQKLDLRPTRGFAKMYLTFKIHKEPLTTRAIISACGSVTEPIASFCNIQLQKIIQHLPYVTRTSKEIVDELTSKSWPNCLLTSADATSMYTNIHWTHAKKVIFKFLTTHEKGIIAHKKSGVHLTTLLELLEITMTRNYFSFGNTFWKQLSGTAMGTPPAPPYSTLFFAIFEIYLDENDLYTSHRKFYKRYIDDTLIAWDMSLPNSLQVFEHYKQDFNTFGIDDEYLRTNQLKPLQWKFLPLKNHTTFLDLNIHINNTGTITTRLFEKPMNLHLYLPPHSCHQKGILKGLIHGEVLRSYLLCSNQSDCHTHIRNTFIRLCHRGHDSTFLRKLFREAIIDKCQPNRQKLKMNQQKNNSIINLHIRHNPADPPLSSLHRIFENTIIHPPLNDHISQISANGSPNSMIEINKLRIVSHRQKSLKDILSPSRLRFPPGFSVLQQWHDFQNNNQIQKP